MSACEFDIPRREDGFVGINVKVGGFVYISQGESLIALSHAQARLLAEQLLVRVAPLSGDPA